MKYIIYKDLGGIKGTDKENYNSHIPNARKINDFSAFSSIDEVKEYVIKYFHLSENEIEIAE